MEELEKDYIIVDAYKIPDEEIEKYDLYYKYRITQYFFDTKTFISRGVSEEYYRNVYIGQIIYK